MLQITVNLEVKTCSQCGFLYAVQEYFVANTSCPRCVYDTIRTAQYEREQAERSAAAVRGALTRLKNQRRKGAARCGTVRGTH